MITISDYTAFRGWEQPLSPAAEKQLEFLISAAIADCERYCRRTFVAPSATIQEIFSGDGTKDYYVKKGRIETLDTPTLEYWDGDSWAASTATIDQDRSTGRIWFNDGSLFTAGRDNWRVTYKPGYTDAASVPLDLKLSVLRYTQALHRLAEGKEGISSESFDGKQTTYAQTAFSKEIKAVWDTYRSYGGN